LGGGEVHAAVLEELLDDAGKHAALVLGNGNAALGNSHL
jgi:hypothetical protein